MYQLQLFGLFATKQDPEKAQLYAQMCRMVQAEAEELIRKDQKEGERLFSLADKLNDESIKLGHNGSWPF